MDKMDWNEAVVINRARLYRDRRDFIIQPGDTGKREDYPGPPWRQRLAASGDDVAMASSV